MKLKSWLRKAMKTGIFYNVKVDLVLKPIWVAMTIKLYVYIEQICFLFDLPLLYTYLIN